MLITSTIHALLTTSAILTWWILSCPCTQTNVVCIYLLTIVFAHIFSTRHVPALKLRTQSTVWSSNKITIYLSCPCVLLAIHGCALGFSKIVRKSYIIFSLFSWFCNRFEKKMYVGRHVRASKIPSFERQICWRHLKHF
jgi:hypothetical protein